eukprot:CAMPEP_0201475612 /NCGR_PEP_ID=MMETSP0151_2-20130828/999_1 /ASSEMBLY_ACC=CAM_ASM_000257 /TAXON_ID=200890 /ORGANISM="Paramoeba atlantica, Strain 621/1 / CCAP 1560/9" /LENGTH=295 /DNA_ID=CAMNT_0047855745 /DNA_START=124 /DNA_END=1011 /DNA_ORIENTATION=-
MAASSKSQHLETARSMIEKGEATEKKFAWFGSTSKYEEAGECYNKAGNSFKMGKSLKEAGDAYMKASKAYLTAGNKHEASSNCQHAAKAYRKVSPPDAIKSLQQTIDYLSDQGRFNVAAKYQQEIAEIYEDNGEEDIDLAIENYTAAAELFEGENQVSSSNKCLLKVAGIHGQKGNYAKAAQLFEKVAENSLDNSLLVWGCKDHFFKAGICNLAMADFDSAKAKLEQYCADDSRFASTRECTLLLSLTQACLDGDLQSYTNAIVKFDAISPLDSWKTSILLTVKKSLKESADGIL